MAGRVEARVRPGGAGRPPKAPLGQERAKCPYRPQFWLRRPIRIRWEEVGHDWRTYITLLAGVLLQTGTLGLDVAYAATRVALFRCDRAGLGTRRGLVSWLAAVVAETLLGGTILCDVPHWTPNEAVTPCCKKGNERTPNCHT